MKRSVLVWLLVFSCIFINNVLVAMANDSNDSIILNQKNDNVILNQKSVLNNNRSVFDNIFNNNVSNISINNIQARQDEPITHTFVFEPIKDVRLDQPFNIIVYAYKRGQIDTSYNDTIMMEYCCGILLNGPQEIKFVKGIGRLNNVKIYSGIATYARMFVYEKGMFRIKYYSNYFSVYNKDGSKEKNINTIDVNVKDIQKNNISNAIIKLYNEHSGNTYTFNTDKNGNYRIRNIPSGVYLIHALHNDKESDRVYIHVKDNNSTFVVLTIQMCNTKATPVILIPGITGSIASVSTSNIVPILPDNNSPLIYWKNFVNVNNLYGLHDPYGVVGWGSLIDTLTNNTNRYIVGCNLFPMPYDWRLHPDNIVNKYLVPWINEIKKRTGATKVNIVAHSMGGLIARAYIQSNNYNNDVDKLIMLGTPHYGSVNAYYLYDGGDPERLDAIVHHINSIWFPNYTRNFYKDITNQMHFLYYNRAPNDNKEKRNLYHLHIPSLSTLTPTFPFIVYNNPSNNAVVSKCIFNNWLNALNNSPNINRLNNINSSIIVGNGYNTISAVVTSNIQDCGRDTYTEGEPRIGNQYRIMDLGDSTVLRSDVLKGINVIEKKSNHSSLVRNSVREIVNILGVADKPNVKSLYIDEYIEENTDITNNTIKQLSILVNATNISLEKNSINITLPDGKVIDIYDLFVDSDKDIKNINNVNIHVEKINNTIMINIYTPNDGVYKLQLSSNTNILISYITKDDTIDISKDYVGNIDFTIVNDKLYTY